MRSHTWVVGLLLMVCLLSAGCSPYRLSGRVVDGSIGGVEVVDQGDARLMRHNRVGVGGAVVKGTIDPNTMKPTELRTVTTDADGFFTLTIPSFGAGMLIYDVEVLVRRSGNRHVEQLIALPGRDRRLIVTMVPGQDTYKPRKDFVDETLRLGEPYMEP